MAGAKYRPNRAARRAAAELFPPMHSRACAGRTGAGLSRRAVNEAGGAPIRGLAAGADGFVSKMDAPDVVAGARSKIRPHPSSNTDFSAKPESVTGRKAIVVHAVIVGVRLADITDTVVVSIRLVTIRVNRAVVTDITSSITVALIFLGTQISEILSSIGEQI